MNIYCSTLSGYLIAYKLEIYPPNECPIKINFVNPILFNTIFYYFNLFILLEFYLRNNFQHRRNQGIQHLL